MKIAQPTISCLYGCFSTRGKDSRYSISLLLSLGLIVLAAYSCLSDASQTGTILCASTYHNPNSKDNYCIYTCTNASLI